jgi:hypothetical protein
VIGEAADRVHIATRREKLEGTNPMWLDATRVRIAPGEGVSRQTGSPVVTAASARVVGTPSAAMASLTMYSRSTGPSAARPSPRREYGVGPAPLSRMSRQYTGAVDDLAKKNGASITELRDESPELVAGISHRERLATLGHQVTRKHLHTLRCGEPFWIEAEVQSELRIQPDQTRCSDRSRPEPRKKAIRQPRVAVIKFIEFDCLSLHVHHGSSASLSLIQSAI